MAIKNMPNFDDFEFDADPNEQKDDQAPKGIGLDFDGDQLNLFNSIIKFNTDLGVDALQNVAAVFSDIVNAVKNDPSLTAMPSEKSIDESIDSLFENCKSVEDAKLAIKNALQSQLSALTSLQNTESDYPEYLDDWTTLLTEDSDLHDIVAKYLTEKRNGVLSLDTIDRFNEIMHELIFNEAAFGDDDDEIDDVVSECDVCLEGYDNDSGNLDNDVTDVTTAFAEIISNMEYAYNGGDDSCDTTQQCCTDTNDAELDELDLVDTHTELFNHILERNDDNMLKTIEYVSFTEDDFIDEFDITDDEIDNNSIDIEKFVKFIPESWMSAFSKVTIASQFIAENNKFIMCTAGMSSGNYMPASFIIYKNKNGEYASYVYKMMNLVTDDNMPVTGKMLYDERFFDVLHQIIMKDSHAMNTSGAFSGHAVAERIQKDTLMTIFSEMRYSEVVINDNIKNMFIDTVENPLMSISKLGEFAPSLVCKQLGDGYVYGGTVQLNMDDTDVKYFISDYQLRPNDGKLDLYVKMADREIPADILPKYKDKVTRFLNPTWNTKIFNNIDVDVIGNAVFIKL